jgi:tetratricopeptide (TPR) repeat protein
MIRRPILATASLVVLGQMLLPASASADPREERICAGLDKGDAFAACTRLIATGTIDKRAIARAYANRATLWDKQGKSDQALADYDAALRFDPNLTAALYNRSAIWLKRKEANRALLDLDRVVALDRADGDALYRRALIRADLNDAAGALRDYDAVIALKPRFAAAYVSRAIEREKAGQIDAAIADCDVAIGIDPAMASAHVTRGALRARKNLIDGAIADFDAAIRINPNYAPPYVNRASLLEKRGERQRALADYLAAARIDPDFAPAHNGVAWALFKLGRPAEALAHIERALALEPNSAEALDTRAGILEALGKLNEAFADISRARSIDPKSTETLESFARIKAKVDASINLRRDGEKPDGSIAIVNERRVALVIGNAAYRGVAPLRNSGNDAESVAAKLKTMGFTSVTLVLDASREELMGKLAAFSRETEAADWAVVYYAGHGMQVDGDNWLIPVDATLRSDRDVKLQAISLEQVRASVEGAKKLRLVILDACRDNPFLAQIARSGGATRSLGRGLARIEPGATLIAFAAKENQVALDGDGSNSPFTEELIKHMATPGLEIDRLFRRVAQAVLARTGNKQEPHVYGRLPDEDFFFMPRSPAKVGSK